MIQQAWHGVTPARFRSESIGGGVLAASLDNDGVDDDTLTYDSGRASIVGVAFEGSGGTLYRWFGCVGETVDGYQSCA